MQTRSSHRPKRALVRRTVVARALRVEPLTAADGPGRVRSTAAPPRPRKPRRAEPVLAHLLPARDPARRRRVRVGADLPRARVRAARGAGGAADREPGEPVARRAALRRRHQPRHRRQDDERPGIGEGAAARAGRPVGAVRDRPLHAAHRRRAALAARPRHAGRQRVNGVPGLWVGFTIEKDPYWLQADPTRVRPVAAAPGSSGSASR